MTVAITDICAALTEVLTLRTGDLEPVAGDINAVMAERTATIEALAYLQQLVGCADMLRAKLRQSLEQIEETAAARLARGETHPDLISSAQAMRDNQGWLLLPLRSLPASHPAQQWLPREECLRLPNGAPALVLSTDSRQERPFYEQSRVIQLTRSARETQRWHEMRGQVQEVPA